jgi:hypothetical protein
MRNFFFIFVLLASCSCQVVKDQAKSPEELNHNRLLIDIDGQKEVGINGTISGLSIIKGRAYGKGSVGIRGLGNCGYYSEVGIGGLGWVIFNVSNLSQDEFCLYHLESNANKLDAPGIGKVLVRRFNDPNIRPLKVTMNRVTRLGVNWLQLKESALEKTVAHVSGRIGDGINEDKNIIVYPSGKSGKMIITGCGVSTVYYYSNSFEWKTTVDNLYKEIGSINQDCVFTITANNDDTLKESCTVLVSVYKEEGGFLAAPMVSIESKRACFTCTDRNAIGIRVNNSWTLKHQSLCIPRTSDDRYEIESITSKQRVFWGVYLKDHWDIVR